MRVGGHAGQLSVDPRYQPFANIGVMERQQMADRALRETEMEIDRPLVAANPTVHEIRNVLSIDITAIWIFSPQFRMVGMGI